MANIAVIAYVAQKMGIIGGPRIVKQDVPATLQDTFKGTAGFVTSLTETVKAAKNLVGTVSESTSAAVDPPAVPSGPSPAVKARPGMKK